MKIIQSGNKFVFQDVTNVYDKLPKGNYLLSCDSNSNQYYLVKKEDFKLPEKLYGDHSEINRWLVSYYKNDKNLGVILDGIKGTGKTITAQKLCVESDLPVIIINQAYRGTSFIDFMSSPVINDCIIFIDEFDKIYSKNPGAQNDSTDFLSLMDGNYKSHKIFLLTVNDFNVNPYLINRPSRVKYRKSYNNLETSVLNDVIDELLVNQSHRESIFEFFTKIDIYTFDLLVTVINEMNLFNEDALTVGKYLNLQENKSQYTVNEVIDGKELICSMVNLSLMDQELSIYRYFLDDEGRYEGKEYASVVKQNLDKINFEKTEVDKLTLKFDGLEFKLKKIEKKELF